MNPDTHELRTYLLGTLDGDSRAQFEERILSQPSIYEELLAAEEELIDQYVAGNLSENEQRQFENHFLITAERQKNLRFGKLLQKYVNSHIAGEKAHASFSIPRKPLRKWSVLAFAGVTLACIAIVCIGWLGRRRSAESVVQQTIPRVVIVTLTPEGLTPQRLIVPPKGVEVKLELELNNATFRNYKSELFRENRSLHVSDELKIEAKGEQSVVPFTVTGEMLSPGDYQIKLSGVSDSGQDAFIDNYSFRVIE